MAAALVATLLSAPAMALEKTAAPFDGDRDAWQRGTDCTITYYNICTGWIWIWSGWSPGDQFGVSFTSCCAGGNESSVVGSWIYFGTGSPAGYGFTGTMEVYDADGNGCPTGASVYSDNMFLPTSGWNFVDLSSSAVLVPDATFAMTYTLSATSGDPMDIWTDHPAAGPTGPASCGSCFPATRVANSFYYGTAASPLCPGSVLNDGVCDAEFIWDVDVSCTVSVEATTWSSVKDLYR